MLKQIREHIALEQDIQLVIVQVQVQQIQSVQIVMDKVIFIVFVVLVKVMDVYGIAQSVEPLCLKEILILNRHLEIVNVMLEFGGKGVIVQHVVKLEARQANAKDPREQRQ